MDYLVGTVDGYLSALSNPQYLMAVIFFILCFYLGFKLANKFELERGNAWLWSGALFGTYIVYLFTGFYPHLTLYNPIFYFYLGFMSVIVRKGYSLIK
jgi:hypothetical protein